MVGPAGDLDGKRLPSSILSLLLAGGGVPATVLDAQGGSSDSVAAMTPPSQTQTQTQKQAPSPSGTTPGVIALDKTTYSPNTHGVYNIAGQTLVPGGSAITVEGTRLSLGPTVTPTILSEAIAATTKPPQSPAYKIGTQTLVPGNPAVMVSGTAYSLASNGASAVVDGQTIAVSTVSASSSQGLGGFIASGLGFGASASAPTTSTSANGLGGGGRSGSGGGIASTPIGTPVLYIPDSGSARIALGRGMAAFTVAGFAVLCAVGVL